MGDEYRITNTILSVAISSLGAELRSLQKDNVEYLWQGDPAFWVERAPNLFPYVGRLTEGSYFVGRKKYRMKIHGFLSVSELAVTSHTSQSVTFSMEDTPETKKQYPWDFKIEICFSLEGNALNICYGVENKDKSNMYFGLGGHPGFQVPLEAGIRFEDYFLEFPKATTLSRIGFTSQCYRSGKDKIFLLQDGRLPLKHMMFDQDAIVLKGTGNEVILKSNIGKRKVHILYPDMPYLGLWHRPFTQAPYLCIEPWTSLPAREGNIEKFEEQPDLICLHPGCKGNYNWRIELM